VCGLTATSEGSNVLERSGLRGGGGNNDGVLHGVVLLEGLDKLGNGRPLLSDGDVDAVQLLGFIGAVVPARLRGSAIKFLPRWKFQTYLVQHGVESHSGLSGLAITNDQLTLTTSDGHHSVDRLETSLDGLLDGLAGQDTGGLELSTALLGGLDGTLAVDGVTEGVDNTSEEGLADGNVNLLLLAFCRGKGTAGTYNLSGTLDSLALLDQSIGTEQHDTDLASFQVHAHALDTGGEPAIPLASCRGRRAGCGVLNELLGLDVVHAMDTGNTVTVVLVSFPVFFCNALRRRTRRRAHVRSRRGCSPPGRHGSSAQGWRRPR
jgi:hypothetical protein